jgi:hypothetical protein
MPITNRAYAKNEGKCFAPLFFAGEKYQFALNFIEPTSDIGFPNFSLMIRRYKDLQTTNSGWVANNVGVLIQDFIDPPFNVFYVMRVNIAAFPDLPFGMYEFVIHDGNTGIDVTTSGPIQVEEMALAKNISKVFWRNSVNRNNVFYENDPTWYQMLHLPLIQIDYNIDSDRKQYRNVTDRRIRNLRNDKDEVVTLESYYFDEVGHLGLAEIFDHDTVFIERAFVVAKTEYKVQGKIENVLSKGTIDVIIDKTIKNPN